MRWIRDRTNEVEISSPACEARPHYALEVRAIMWSVIFEYICAVLLVGVFIALPWLVFLSIGGQDKAFTLLTSLNHATFWLISVRTARYAIHDILESESD